MNQSIFDMSIEILKKTNDGNNLSSSHLLLIQNAANDNINGKGTRLLQKIYDDVIKGTYTKPIFWLCGIKDMTQDENRSVYYKGIKVEHFDHNFWCSEGWQERMKKDTIEAKKACKILEKKGIEINFSNVLDYLIAQRRAKREALKN